MTNQPDAKYFLIDADQQAVLIHGFDLPVMLFVQRVVIDSRIISIFEKNWTAKLANQQPVDGFFKIDRDNWKLHVVSVNDVTRAKRERARLMASGYAYLLWMANLSTEFYWSTVSIDINDLPLLSTMRENFIQSYAKCKNIETDAARKQIEFDEQNLKSLILRRKEILWEYEQSLIKLYSSADLAEWKQQLHDDIFKVGAI